MEALWTVQEDCGLGDLGFPGSRFTWSNKRHDCSFTHERLDRAYSNRGWSGLFKEVSVQVLAARSSDHNPLLVNYAEQGRSKADKK